MAETVQFSVNIALESSMILVLIVLLVTCIWQRKVFPTTIPLCILTASIIMMLVIQIVTWSMLICEVPLLYGEMPMRIVYFFDYVFSYGTSIAFYYYVEALIIEGYKRTDVKYNGNKFVHKLIVFWGIGSSILYGIALFIPSIYHIEDGVAVYSMTSYVCMHVMADFTCICAAILIIRHRRVISKHEVALSLCFLVLVSVFIVVDELCGICVSYVLSSLFVFVLYVGIDLHKGLLIERQEKEVVELQTKIMLSQMRPHFMYNVLTTISGMCEMQNAIQARDVVNKFAEYFRSNLDSLGKEKTISFKKELEHIETYLWLEKIRFEDSLNISYEIGPTDFEVPSLAIQPIVENAVKHGIMQKEDAGTVVIRTRENMLYYVIEIEDDGVGFDVNQEVRDGHVHVGIENVRKRLEIICGGTCNIHSEIGKGTLVSINIPKGDQI